MKIKMGLVVVTAIGWFVTSLAAVNLDKPLMILAPLVMSVVLILAMAFSGNMNDK